MPSWIPGEDHLINVPSFSWPKWISERCRKRSTIRSTSCGKWTSLNRSWLAYHAEITGVVQRLQPGLAVQFRRRLHWLTSTRCLFDDHSGRRLRPSLASH